MLRKMSCSGLILYFQEVIKSKQVDRNNKQGNEIRSGDSARNRCENENEEKLFEKYNIIHSVCRL